MKFRANIVFMFGAILMIITGCAKSSSVQLFNDDWYFKITDEPVHEQNADLESWESVSIPHTPIIEPKVMKGQWQGICWYQKTFEVPLKHKGQRLLMKFDGAMNTCDVWVNGIKVATHMGGYLPVVFDFTHAALFGKKNKVLVRLNNHDNPVTGPKPTRLLDFNMYGGLYRDVFLIIKNPLHITDPVLAAKPASGGVFVTYPEVSATEAIVQVKTHVVNSGKKAKTYSVQNELWYEKQMVASVLSVQGLIKEDEQTEIISKLKVSTPKLWSPRSPSLYTLKTKLLSKGQVVDEVSTRIGIRRIEIRKDSFSVNGEKMFLRGVNRHQDYPYIGYALSNEAQYREAFKIKSAGFDFVRLSHYPHAPAFMDACDELGILVLDAILGWQYNPNSDAFREHILQTCRDLMRRDRNHPCVLAWELSLNESRMDNAFIDKAHLIAHEEYPGDQCYTAGWQRYRYDIFLQARQHRLGKYSDPLKPYIVSEYGDWEYYAQNAGFDQDSWSDLLQSERSSRQLLADGEVRLLQQATNIQEAHNDNFNTAAFADGYWVMFDYNRGYADDLEASGLMSIDRIPKFSYYFFQSQRPAIEHSQKYASGPMVHIASWWTKDSPLNVRVFSNCDEVELFLNGRSLGTRKPDINRISGNLAHPPFTFPFERFERGILLAKGYIEGKEVASHVVRTPGEAVRLVLEIDESGRPPKSDCNDVVFVYAKIVDEHGTVIRDNSRQVFFDIKGDAKVVNPEAVYTEAGIGTALLKIGKQARYITLTANVDGLTGEIKFRPR